MNQLKRFQARLRMKVTEQLQNLTITLLLFVAMLAALLCVVRVVTDLSILFDLAKRRSSSSYYDAREPSIPLPPLPTATPVIEERPVDGDRIVA